MAQLNESVIRVDGQTLRYGGKVFPLRNIAYFEISKEKWNTGIRKSLLSTLIILVVTVLLASALSVENGSAGAPILVGALVISGSCIFWFINWLKRRKNFFLVLQTNAGGSPRLLTTRDEKFLADLTNAVSDRLVVDNALPPVTANVTNNTFTIGDTIMGDTIEVNDNSGIIGAIGSGAHVSDMNASQTWNQINEGFDPTELVSELAELVKEMRDGAAEPYHYASLTEVARAEEAAKAGNNSKVMEHLKAAGGWALQVATQMGSKLVVEAIKQA